MTTRLEIAIPVDDPSVEALCRLSAWAFGFPVETWRGLVARVGAGACRVARRGREVVGGLFLLPMGHFFGGRSVPMVGLAGVAVAPEHRGAGVGTALLRATIDELGRSGAALSTLFPATEQLYRSVGYEVAGSRHKLTARPADLAVDERALAARPVEAEDDRAIAALYREVAAASPGHLDRNPYMWARVRRGEPSPARGWVVEGDAGLEGYVYLAERVIGRGRYELEVTDVAARSVAGARRILALVRSHGTVAEGVEWHGGLGSPLLWPLAERRYRAELSDLWMVRLLDLSRALEARGYPAALEAELGLEVEDELLPQNRGRFLLSVRGGRAEVRAGGDGALRADVRGLAALFTGYAAPANLAARGLLAGEPAAMALAAALFSGPSPWMPDRF